MHRKNQVNPTAESSAPVPTHPLHRVRPPAWLLERDKITTRQWKIRKRRELNDVIKAMAKYRMGCAFCPGVNGEVATIEEALNSLKQYHTAKVWGR